MDRDDIPVQSPQSLESAEEVKSEFDSLDARLVKIEEQLDLVKLSHESAMRDLLISEIRQRISMRTWSLRIAISIMVFMGFVLFYTMHSIRIGPFLVAPQSVTVAIFAAPIISITTLAVVLLVGAFRRFKDEDINNVSMGSLAAEATRQTMG